MSNQMLLLCAHQLLQTQPHMDEAFVLQATQWKYMILGHKIASPEQSTAAVRRFGGSLPKIVFENSDQADSVDGATERFERRECASSVLSHVAVQTPLHRVLPRSPQKPNRPAAGRLAGRFWVSLDAGRPDARFEALQNACVNRVVAEGRVRSSVARLGPIPALATSCQRVDYIDVDRLFSKRGHICHQIPAPVRGRWRLADRTTLE